MFVATVSQTSMSQAIRNPHTYVHLGDYPTEQPAGCTMIRAKLRLANQRVVVTTLGGLFYLAGCPSLKISTTLQLSLQLGLIAVLVPLLGDSHGKGQYLTRSLNRKHPQGVKRVSKTPHQRATDTSYPPE
eukprot:5798267-Amphidinium_carterae.1